MSLKFKIAAAICCITLAAVLFMHSPFFHIREVLISGYDTVSRTELYTRLELSNRANLLFFNTSNARQRIMENLYIDEVSFSRALPNRLYVTVEERRLSAFVEHMPGSFLYIDEFGRVLEVRTFFTESFPVVRGLNFTHFQLGEILDVEDPTAFGIVVRYAQVLNYHGLISRVSHIDVSDTANMRIVIYNVEFNVGDTRQADEKVQIIIEILNNVPDIELHRAIIDLRERRREYFLQILP